MIRRPPTRIALHIDTLVLHGFPPGARRAIAAAIERELTALVAGRGLPAAFARPQERLDGGTLRLSGGAPPEVAGARIAGALYEGAARSEPPEAQP